MTKLQMTMMLLAGLGFLALLPGAKADVWNQKTVISFSDAVEVPGQVLPAGKYVFKLLNSHSSRHVVQVFNEEENHVFATFLTISSYRSEPSDKTIVRFHDRPSGSPVAIRAWFYPGKTNGHEFVYPKTKAMALAKANDTPVPAMAVEFTPEPSNPEVALSAPEAEAMSEAPVKAEEPNGDEVEITQAFPAHQPEPGLPSRLPTTASPLPLIGLIGLLSLGTAANLRLAAAKAK